MELAIIQNKIHEIRGFKVMLDFDLAEMYGTETKRLKEQVRRNISRFPEDFMFELTREEYNSLRTQIATLENDDKNLKTQITPSKRGKYSKYLPYAFTEQGVAMLSSILNSELAIATNIRIMRAFVAVRRLLFNPEINELKYEIKELKQYIEEVFEDYNDINDDTRMQLELINETLAELQVRHKELKPRPVIGFRASQEYQNKKEN